MSMHEMVDRRGLDISLALITVGDRYLMQLRDFDPEIADPGMWGFFAGHGKVNERPDEAMRRELWEELRWEPSRIWFLGTTVFDALRLHVFHSAIGKEVSRLTLREGQDMSVFSADQIRHNRLQSPRLKRHYPPTPAARHLLGLFHGISKSFDRYLPEKDRTSQAR